MASHCQDPTSLQMAAMLGRSRRRGASKRCWITRFLNSRTFQKAGCHSVCGPALRSKQGPLESWVLSTSVLVGFYRCCLLQPESKPKKKAEKELRMDLSGMAFLRGRLDKLTTTGKPRQGLADDDDDDVDDDLVVVAIVMVVVRIFSRTTHPVQVQFQGKTKQFHPEEISARQPSISPKLSSQQLDTRPPQPRKVDAPSSLAGLYILGVPWFSCKTTRG